MGIVMGIDLFIFLKKLLTMVVEDFLDSSLLEFLACISLLLGCPFIIITSS